jgi:zinc protease
MAVVGDGDADALWQKMPAWFMKSAPVSYERIKRPFINNVVKDVTLNTKDKEMAIIAYAFNFAMRDDHDDYAAMKLANYMFGENMNSRLMTRIREKEGISYGAGSSLEISRHEENASINLYAMSAPQSVSRARFAIEEEWSKFIAEGVGEAELNSAKESIWLSYENMLANDGFLASTLAYDLDIGRDFIWRENLYLRMKTLSARDIKSKLEKWWGNAKFSKVTAGDQSKLI